MTSAIIPATVRKLLASQPIELPIFHPVALKLQRMLSNYDFTVDEVALVANEDTALASQMLKMANSPMYMGRTKVATIREVVIRLGAQQVDDFISALPLCGSRHAARDPDGGGDPPRLSRHRPVARRALFCHARPGSALSQVIVKRDSQKIVESKKNGPVPCIRHMKPL